MNNYTYIEPTKTNNCKECNKDLRDEFQYRIQLYKPNANVIIENSTEKNIAVLIFCVNCWKLTAGNNFFFNPNKVRVYK